MATSEDFRAMTAQIAALIKTQTDLIKATSALTPSSTSKLTYVLGNIAQFKGRTGDDFKNYLLTFIDYCLLNQITTDNEKKQLFLSVVGQETVNLLRDLIFPDTTAKLDYAEIVQKLTEHYEETTRTWVEKHRFGDRKRQPNETVAAYLATLRGLARSCGFKTKEETEEALLTQFIRGIANDKLREKLLEQDILTLEKAIKIAKAAEVATHGQLIYEGKTSISMQPLPASSVKDTPLTTDITMLKSENQAQINRDKNRWQTRQQPYQQLPWRRNRPNQQNLPRPRWQTDQYKDVAKERTIPRQQQQSLCRRCGRDHYGRPCRYSEFTCNKCGRVGHLARVCLSTNRPEQQQTIKSSGQWQRRVPINRVRDKQDKVLNDKEIEPMDLIYPLNVLLTEGNRYPPIYKNVRINDIPIVMLVDTGSELSLISIDTFKLVWPTRDVAPPITPTTSSLRSFTGQEIKPIGSVNTLIKVADSVFTVNLLIINDQCESIMGRNILNIMAKDTDCLIKNNEYFMPNISVNTIDQINEQIESLKEQYADVFRNELGLYRGDPLKLVVDPSIIPRFYRPRPIPIALRPKVESALLELQQQHVLEPIKYSQWATPIVVVPKSGGQIRICGDYKSTINIALQPDPYPLPKISELLAQLAGRKYFSKLDIKQAYQQRVLDYPSSLLVAINTHKGLFRVTRMPFGIISAAGEFQRLMEREFNGMDLVLIYQDDMLLATYEKQTHIQLLKQVLDHLRKIGLRLTKDKCVLFCKEVEFLGFHINVKGISPLVSRLGGILDSKSPKSVSELRSFLGMVNFYHHFLPAAATLLAPLHLLLKKDVTWQWGKDQTNSFETVKKFLISDRVLVHFDPTYPIVLAVDASPVGVGAVLAHVIDGYERPVAYASKSLSLTQQNYGHIPVHKEAFALVFGIRHFHIYLFEHSFVVYTDHKPLVSLFAKGKPIPEMAPPRMIRWLLQLSAYDFIIKYRPGPENCNADALSRSPLCEVNQTQIYVDEDIDKIQLLLVALDGSPIDRTQLVEETKADPLLQEVMSCLLSDRPTNSKYIDLKPYSKVESDLSVVDGLIFRGLKVVIPQKLRGPILDIIHQGHPGIVVMKQLARSYVWWPNINVDIERYVKTCITCQMHSPLPPRAAPIPWPIPLRPWERIHVDFAGPVENRMFLVLVDTYTNWLEVAWVSNMLGYNPRSLLNKSK